MEFENLDSRPGKSWNLCSDNEFYFGKDLDYIADLANFPDFFRNYMGTTSTGGRRINLTRYCKCNLAI